MLTEQPGAGSFPLLVPGQPPRTPILFTYHEGDELHVTAGRAPSASDEIIVDADVLSRYKVGVGSEVSLLVREQTVPFTIVGTFDLPGVDLTGIPLAAMSAAYQPRDLPVDRLDVKFEPGANVAKVRDAIAIAVGNYTVSAPSVDQLPRPAARPARDPARVLGAAEPRRQGALGLRRRRDRTARSRPTTRSTRTSPRTWSCASRTSRSSPPTRPRSTFRIYYGGSPSPIIDKPANRFRDARRRALAARHEHPVLARRARSASSARATRPTCRSAPPNGYEPISSLDPEVVQAFETIADPNATVDERVAAVAGGNTWRSIIEAGVARDRAYSGKTTLSLAGWRSVAPTRIEVLYSLQTDGGPSTPYPLTEAALKTLDGHWYAAEDLACGISGLASGGCPEVFDQGHAGSP